MATTTTSATNTAADIYAQIAPASSKQTTSATADLENRFLTLLTTQLKNQDPLNPMENAEVTSQLAQINTVNGIEKLNATMGQLLSAYSSMQTMQAASVIGKYVLTAGSGMQLYEGAAVAGVTLEGDADKVMVTIKDADGKVVQTADLGAHAAGTFSFVWDGKNDAGETMADGAYTFSIEAKKGGEEVKATQLQLGMVNAVTMKGNGFVLDLGDGRSVAFEDVQQIL